ncbi:hypothetical protein [Isobaculum melis]|uniref:Uncharacterized protein n=1 Tax=Isobaculum melis TaxID=142588 RepID=A0A1H9PP84_9LACT|nr:hypothetical protein [Isobaculum melis]SER49373.1 hypothetical protein SAMN04488559_10117 [Isobaculum melis]
MRKEKHFSKNHRHSVIILLFSSFMIFMYAMGIYDLLMMLSHNSSYYQVHGYGQSVVAYFTNYPFPFLILWIANLMTGVLAPIFLLLLKKKNIAKKMALISTIADAILLLGTFLLKNRLAVLGPTIARFDLFILFLTFSYYLFCLKIRDK